MYLEHYAIAVLEDKHKIGWSDRAMMTWLLLISIYVGQVLIVLEAVSFLVLSLEDKTFKLVFQRAV